MKISGATISRPRPTSSPEGFYRCRGLRDHVQHLKLGCNRLHCAAIAVPVGNQTALTTPETSPFTALAGNTPPKPPP